MREMENENLKLNLNAVSGDLEATGCTITESADFDTTSGAVTAERLGALRELCVSTVSGKASVTSQSVDTGEMGSTSGDLLLSVEEAPDRIDISTGSGAVTLILPGDTGMTLRFDTVSGRLSSELPGETDGEDSVFGDRTCAGSVETTSGDLRIQVNGRDKEDTKYSQQTGEIIRQSVPTVRWCLEKSR